MSGNECFVVSACFCSTHLHMFFSLGVDQAGDAVPSRLLGLHLFCRRDDSLLLGRPGSHVLGESPAPRWPIWGSVIHHTAGGHVLWKGHELVTSLGQPALCVKAIFLFLPSSAPLPPPLRGPSLPRTRRCIEIIGLYSEWPGCQCGFRIEIFSLGATSSLWPPF